MEGLNEKVTAMVGKQFDIRDELKKVERKWQPLASIFSTAETSKPIGA